MPYYGLDISKDYLDLVTVDGAIGRFPYTPEGIDDVLDQLTPSTAQLLVLEATGGLEHAVAAALAAVGFPVAVVNPSFCQNVHHPNIKVRCPRDLAF
ncbi:hypothetical protein CRI94_10840 [Longibacter salinarum]|uniref:IS110 family transposase n=1 Tax=Longibacter salinarum TaxID=1850348 RepID=A0A2A8CWW9_9BACT|nr:hypothetical protein [Longibacter salinarum]PEN13136.1 hypothetical protein CRI94_10840 [Longibacter salinarum]